MKWYAMIAANQSGKMTLYKTNHQGIVFPKDVVRADWVSEAGYRCHATSSSEREDNNTKFIQTAMLVKAEFPGNQALEDIIQKRMGEALKLTPEEMRRIEDAQKELRKQQAMAAMSPVAAGAPGAGASGAPNSGVTPGVTPSPGLPGAGGGLDPALVQELQGKMKELQHA